MNRLLGITRDSIIRLDGETRVKSYSLKSLCAKIAYILKIIRQEICYPLKLNRYSFSHDRFHFFCSSKTVISHYPLTHLRRWAANPGTFTMDFGDYEDEYVVVQTTEGDAISQLIAGYIDIILQKRRGLTKYWEQACQRK